jgi:diguanylate cyclase (GGDEF)-like protein
MNDKTSLNTTVCHRSPETASSEALRGFTLTVMRGAQNDYGAIYSFDPRRVIIGRSHQADLLFQDQSISKQHCAIEVWDEGDRAAYHVKDLGSTNGTRINGLLIKTSQKLSNGDKIELGDTTLRFNTRDELDSEYQEHLLRMATIDPLTSLLNKAFLLRELERHFQHAQRYQRPLSLLMIDIDHFKRINDTHGHLIGDQILTHIARQFITTLRQHDVAGRFGGEEFTVILPETPVHGAITLAERICEAVANAPLEVDDLLVRATVSIGVSECTSSHICLAQLMDDADQALYQAKQGGRNRVMAGSPPNPC